MTFIALTRAVPASIVSCELTHLDREPINVEIADAQHAAYEAALRASGCRVERLDATPDLPDSVFVEDIAVVLDELAVITRPGASSRRPESASVATALARYRDLVTIAAPGFLDGGDVLCVGRRIFVGLSSRTNAQAVEQLRGFVTPHGYSVESVTVRGVLHLKSAVTRIGASTLLINRALIDATPFRDFDQLETDPDEPAAANALLVESVLLFPTAFPKTRERLEKAGLDVRTVDASELAKAEGALTCCSLLLRV